MFNQCNIKRLGGLILFTLFIFTFVYILTPAHWDYTQSAIQPSFKSKADDGTGLRTLPNKTRSSLTSHYLSDKSAFNQLSRKVYWKIRERIFTLNSSKGVQSPSNAATNDDGCPFVPPKFGIENGAWNYTKEVIAYYHVAFDPGFGKALMAYLQGATVADIGAGVGQFGFFLKQHNSDIKWHGFDGGYNVQDLYGQHTPLNGYENYTVPKVCWVDASKPFTLPNKPEWVVSIEVGEHIPKSSEATFLDNIVHNCRVGAVLTWAVVGQGGYKHVNCQNNDYIIEQMRTRNMTYDAAESTRFRQTVTNLPWLRNTIMVFKK